MNLVVTAMYSGTYKTSQIVVREMPGIPSRILKMSRRRQKIAVRSMLAAALYGELHLFIGRPMTPDVRAEMKVSMRKAMDSFWPTYKVELLK